MSAQTPYIIVLGNEKGGTGKSTLSMHLITHLLRLGFSVGSIDVDARQGTLTRYIENRQNTIKTRNLSLPLPDHHPIFKSTKGVMQEAEAEEIQQLDSVLNQLHNKDFIVIDTPGSDSFLSRLTHSYADTLITPLNDSFVDLDMLARLDSQTGEVVRPSTYSEMVWEQKKCRLMRGGSASFDWIVVRNRLSNLNARNKEEMLVALQKLAQRIGFRFASGFGERVIFRSLFLSGLTLLDLKDAGIDISLSHIAARQELRALLQMIRLPQLEQKLAEIA
jgi:chromosome partitioning protein